MIAQMFLCLGIFLFMMLGFLFMKKLHTILVVASICTVVLVTFSGIIPASVISSRFVNHNILLITDTVVVSVGFSRTQAVSKLSSLVFKIGKDGLGMQMLGYYVPAFLLTNSIPNPMVTSGIMAPVTATFRKRNDINPSKVMQPIALVCIRSIGTAPFGSGMYTCATANSVTEGYGYTDYMVKIPDSVKGQLIISTVLVIYAASIAPKLAPNQPSIPVTLDDFTNRVGAVNDAPPLDPVREVLGYGTSLLTTVGLISVDTLGLQSWQIAVTDTALITAVGILKTQGAIDAIPVSTILMLVAAYAAGGAVEACGLGDMIGSLLASALDSTRSGHITGFTLFIVPLLLTQFMQNFSVDNLLQPVIIMVSKALGCDPIGLLLVLGSARNSAFMAPTSTDIILPMTETDGHSQKDPLRMG